MTSAFEKERVWMERGEGVEEGKSRAVEEWNEAEE